MGTKYDTYILELIRSNGMQQINGTDKSGKIKELEALCVDRFLMFDYFDILYHKELFGAEKQYTYYFSVVDPIKNDEQFKVSQKTLSLYQHRDNQINVNPFEVGRQGEDICLSDRPFLGVIQICLCKEVFVGSVPPGGNVDRFLCEIEQKILWIADEALGIEQSRETIKKIYRSSTTGDFCLALRTNSITDIYRVSSRLNDSQNSRKDNLKMMTYTNVGVECRVDKDGKYCTFSEDFLQRHGENMIALRFTADSSILSLLNQCTNKLKLKKGLFGRYDYLLHINVKEFAKIYPCLCVQKFGAVYKGDLSGTEQLEKLILHPRVRYINERILVEIPESLGQEGGSESDGEVTTNSKELEQMEQRNNALLRKIIE